MRVELQAEKDMNMGHFNSYVECHIELPFTRGHSPSSTSFSGYNAQVIQKRGH